MDGARTESWKVLLICGMAVLLGGLTAGCEDGGGGGGEPAAATTEENATVDDDSPHPNFPDGLHPDATANGVIAARFSSNISPVAGGTIVCLGDSITAGGYPAILAGLTGMTVDDQARPGETSGGGASRAAGSIGAAQYVCILYGANDAIHGGSPETVAGNIEAIIGVTRAAGAIPVVGTLTPMSGGYAWLADEARAISAAIRAMAGRTGTAVADLENAF